MANFKTFLQGILYYLPMLTLAFDLDIWPLDLNFKKNLLKAFLQYLIHKNGTEEQPENMAG